jgi:hypothetical protein
MSNEYRKKPVVIQAAQWFKVGDHPAVRAYWTHDPDCKEWGWIETLEGGHIVTPGDWIITGVKGETYPCKDEIFRLTYEPAAVATQRQDEPAAIPWHHMSQHRRDFIAKGESFVRSLYNDPKDDVRTVEVGAWIQYANQLLQRQPDSPSAQQATGSGQVLTDEKVQRALEGVQGMWDVLDRLCKDGKQVTSYQMRHWSAALSIIEALAAATQAQPETQAAYHAWAGSIDDEVTLRKAVSVCDDVLTDIADWEDKALAEAVASVREDLCAMADRIKEDGTPDLAAPTTATQARTFAGFSVVVDPSMPSDTMKLVTTPNSMFGSVGTSVPPMKVDHWPSITAGGRGKQPRRVEQAQREAADPQYKAEMDGARAALADAKDAERYRTLRSYATGNAIEQMLAQSIAAERSAREFDAAVDVLILARRKAEDAS